MRQTVSGAFRSGLGLNLADQTSGWTAAYASVRTRGATLVDQAAFIGPALAARPWSVLTASVQGYLGFMSTPFTPPAVPVFGQLGRIVAGFVPDGSVSPTYGPGVNQPYVIPMLNLPTDATQLGTLWNPASDPMPPQVAFSAVDGVGGVAPSALLPVGVSIQPPNAVELLIGESPRIGIWMTPSLLGTPSGSDLDGGYGLVLIGATYTINYDDGL